MVFECVIKTERQKKRLRGGPRPLSPPPPPPKPSTPPTRAGGGGGGARLAQELLPSAKRQTPLKNGLRRALFAGVGPLQRALPGRIAPRGLTPAYLPKRQTRLGSAIWAAPGATKRPDTRGAWRFRTRRALTKPGIAPCLTRFRAPKSPDEGLAKRPNRPEFAET